MALSIVMQSFLASPLMGLSHKTRLNHLVPEIYMPRLPKNVSLRVKSMTERDDLKEESVPGESALPSAAPNPKPAPKIKESTKLSDILAFSGPAPERINGRLAMVGFVAAIGMELANGQDLLTQLTNDGALWFLGTSILFSVASLIPLFRGVSVQSKSEGLMNSDAELWNGRFAMLGLVALAFTEFVKGGALV